MGGVFKIKPCKHLDPTEFHIRFWSDFALISDQLELILKRLDRRQSPLGPALEVQRTSLVSDRCEEVVGEPGCKSDHPVLTPPGPPKRPISAAKEAQTSSRTATKSHLEFSWQQESIFTAFCIKFRNIWKGKTMKKHGRGLRNQALQNFRPDRVPEQILGRF